MHARLRPAQLPERLLWAACLFCLAAGCLNDIERDVVVDAAVHGADDKIEVIPQQRSGLDGARSCESLCSRAIAQLAGIILASVREKKTA